ncbi:MAG: DUF4010 domain-containing protein [Vicinamibacteraceae bacterium]|nr:DUF4010 domain-containing protein [Vicinamibacteraceae bacterium]
MDFGRPELVLNLAVALLVGALIGIEREKRKARDAGVGIAGLRTFIMFALSGAVSAWLSQTFASPWPLAAGIVAAAALVVAAYVAETSHGAGHESLGLTTEIAALATFLLGAMAIVAPPVLTVALGVVVAGTLALKEPLHSWVDRLGVEDVHAGLKLLAATFIVLPLLPNREMGPYQAFNPFELWALVILISALSLVGYVAVRILGTERGTLLTGLFGGLASSTAVTLTFAKDSREQAQRPVDAFAAGILVAWVVMFARVVVEVGVVYPPLLLPLAWPLGIMGAVTVLLAAWYVFRRPEPAQPSDLHLRTPFSLTSAIKFAALFGLVLFAVAFVRQAFPGRGELVVAALAGLTDVDAITLSMATRARDGADAGVAAAAIVVAAVTNTLVKGGLVASLGAAALRWRIVAATVSIAAAGLLTLAL